LAEKRAAAGLTLRQLADLCGVTFQACHLWETGKAMPQVDRLPTIVAAVDCTYEDLLGPRL
jgi:transcriptional regulator with XRE-family HTH domain